MILKKKLVLKKKYSILLVTLSMILIFVIVLGTSYAFFTTSAKAKEFVIYTGNLAVNYTKKTDVINIVNLYPMTNTEGLQQTAHEFTVTNNGNIDARYQVRLELDNTLKDMIPIEYIKLAYNMDGGSYSEPILLSDLNSNLVFLKNIIIKSNLSNTFSIKMWIDLNAPNDIQGKEFKAKVVVDSIQNVDDGYVVDTAPIIYLNKDSSGNQDIHLKVNETYQELGVEKVEDDQEIFTSSEVEKSYEYYDGINLTTVDSVDTSKTGIYYITYTITDKSNNIGKTLRVVTINNTDTIPTITLNGDSTISLEETEEYVEPGVIVSDGNKVITIGEVKTSTIGTYIIRYIVIDKSGNLNSVIRTVSIIKATTLYDKILAHNTLIETQPTLTTSSNNTYDLSGLYKSTETNTGNPTYYFRGNVENNYVKFAGSTWRIIRINEDGTIRIWMTGGINNNVNNYPIHSNSTNYENMYYSNSEAKLILEDWYTENITNKGYSDKVATGDYYCEQAKVVYADNYSAVGNTNTSFYEDYTSNFKCTTDKNGYGLVYASVGLITYDEVVHAGGYPLEANSDYYLVSSSPTMSLAGFSSYGNIWMISSQGNLGPTKISNNFRLRAVINLVANVIVTGSGTIDNPYIVVP